MVFLFVIACGGSKTPPPAEPTSAPPAPTVAEPQPTATELDRAATSRALAAVDLTPCRDKPPILDAPLHVSLTIMATGRVEPSADKPYAGTDAGNCAEALFRQVRVPAWIGTPKTMGRTVPRAAVVGSASDPPFDPAAARAAVARADLSECAELWGNGDRTRATMRVQPNGIVASVSIEPPLNTSPKGDCIVRVLNGVMFQPYSGEPASPISVDVQVQPHKK
jgi:hypothetical protein